MSGVKKSITNKIVGLYGAGMDIPEIIRTINGTYPQVASAIRRSDLFVGREKPQVTNLEGLKRRYNITTGSMGTALIANSSPEVWVFAAEHTLNNGYNNMAEYLIDLLVEAYYEQGGKG
tara:strand:- start:229 stop:585 length:357 start_codon:yes stop_codon:yes gene_type:complete